jgi:hypothetical protein
MPTHQQNADEVKAWKARWEAVNRFEFEELRRTPTKLRLQQLATLMFAAQTQRSNRKRDREDAQVQSRWVALRRAHGV